METEKSIAPASSASAEPKTKRWIGYCAACGNHVEQREDGTWFHSANPGASDFDHEAAPDYATLGKGAPVFMPQFEGFQMVEPPNPAVYRIDVAGVVKASEPSVGKLNPADTDRDPTPRYDMSIHTNPDARAWAEFFFKTVQELEDKAGHQLLDHATFDVDLMHTWFANAMMAMYDHLHAKYPARFSPPASSEAPEDMPQHLPAWFISAWIVFLLICAVAVFYYVFR